MSPTPPCHPERPPRILQACPTLCSVPSSCLFLCLSLSPVPPDLIGAILQGVNATSSIKPALISSPCISIRNYLSFTGRRLGITSTIEEGYRKSPWLMHRFWLPMQLGQHPVFAICCLVGGRQIALNLLNSDPHICNGAQMSGDPTH